MSASNVKRIVLLKVDQMKLKLQTRRRQVSDQPFANFIYVGKQFVIANHVQSASLPLDN
jgi:hypothetical protein